MDISKIEAGMVEVVSHEVNINLYIEDIHRFFSIETREKGIQLSYKEGLPTEESVIFSDGNKVQGILTNLIKNALKFTRQGSIDFGYVRKDKQLEFYVKDTGMGIPKDRQEAIFERFIQADIEDKMALQGTGLGLSIVKAHVELLGGKIWMEYSEPGKGSEFRFTLPYKPVHPKSTDNNAEEKETKKEASIKTTSKELKVLVAEDDETSYQYLSILLKDLVGTILFARNGKEAVEMFKDNPDIDLILMDMRMPVMSGFQAVKEIRKLDKNIVIIAQTAHALTGDKEKIMAAGCNDYLAKPTSGKALKNIIAKHF
jgi:CheY-like chemotaxis protein